MRLSLRLTFCAILAGVLSQAQAETTTLLIQLRTSKYPYQCNATACFGRPKSIDGSIRNQQSLVKQTCAASWVNDVGKASCEHEQEVLGAMQQCEQACVRAWCHKLSMSDGTCTEGAIFQ